MRKAFLLVFLFSSSVFFSSTVFAFPSNLQSPLERLQAIMEPEDSILLVSKSFEECNAECKPRLEACLATTPEENWETRCSSAYSTCLSMCK